MRTTLTLEDDVAVLLEEIQRHRGVSFKQLVNEALREGLVRMGQASPSQTAFRTQPVDLGKCFFPGVDNVWEVLEEADWDESGPGTR